MSSGFDSCRIVSSVVLCVDAALDRRLLQMKNTEAAMIAPTKAAPPTTAPTMAPVGTVFGVVGGLVLSAVEASSVSVGRAVLFEGV